MRFWSKFWGAFILFLLLLVLPQSASADQTASLLPVSEGNYLQWTTKSGTVHYTEVDETTCDGQTTYNHTTTAGDRDSYGISLSSIPDGSTITQLDITPCASRTATGGTNPIMNVFYRLNGVDSSDAGNYSLTGATPVVLSTTTFSSLSTVKSSSTTLEIGSVLTSGAKGARLSQEAVKVTYTPLSAPSGLTAVASSTAEVLNWTDNASNEDGFKIERSNGGSFVQIATVGANVTTFTDTPLTEGTYTYRVRAYNSGGNSSYSNNASDSVIPAPSNLTATAANSTTVNLSWTDNATTEAGFKIEIATGAGQFIQIATVGANVTSYANTTVTSNTTYHYRVRAYKSATNSDYSNTADVTVLKAPSGLSAVATSSDVTLNWTDNSTGEDGFKIERSDNGGAFVQINTVGSNITTYDDTPIGEGNYTYRVRAYNTSGNSSYSLNSALVYVIPAPSSLTAVAINSTSVSLSWVDNATTEAGFKIEIATGAGQFVQIATVGANVTSYSNTTVSAPHDYHYRVRAYKNTGNSNYSNTADTTVLVAPSGLTATNASGSADVNLNWTDNSSNEDGFLIERGTDGINFSQIDSVGSNISTYTDPGLTTGTYYYRVRGYKGSDDSSYTNTANVTLP